jgi:bifunctional UDP-N-acetylglucosamine pyrophosphorylase/glucosamine-1-phosphate N-acetyltransferase
MIPADQALRVQSVPLSVVVLAAGQGKRMQSALPKVLHSLAGKPLLAHVVDTARSLEPAEIHIVCGYGGDAVRSALPDADLSWCVQAEQLGTGHAVDQAMPGIPDDHDVLVLCGDVPLISAQTLATLLTTAEGTALAVLSAHVENATGYGRIVRGDGGAVTRIVEQKDADANELTIKEINTGIIVASASRLRSWLGRIQNDNSQGEYYLTDVVSLASSDGVEVRAETLADAEEAMGINDKVQLAQSERRYQQRIARKLLAQGATLADPTRIDVRGNLDIGQDVFIDVGAVFEGEVTLGNNCRIGPYCIIRNSTIGAGTEIYSHSVIDAATIGAVCSIGPFARMRPATELADNVKIGNFVETKGSRIASGSKVNHLSYVGDTTIGGNVNVGAGTVTCNYDGANKHHTTIGDDVFIGSGVNLVAPVEIGAGATIGAGSTVTKHAPDEKLTIARSRQTTIDGWRRPTKKPD